MSSPVSVMTDGGAVAESVLARGEGAQLLAGICFRGRQPFLNRSSCLFHCVAPGAMPTALRGHGSTRQGGGLALNDCARIGCRTALLSRPYGSGEPCYRKCVRRIHAR